jgi:pyruvate dehydrogenase E1 component alpha subunit
MSLAALWKLPVVYIIENNHFAMGTPIEKTSATEDLSIRALGFPMARESVDGHDVFAVRSAVHTAVRRAREKKLPTLIEAKTYRYRGHSMADPGTYRTKEEVAEWKERDPISSLGAKLDSFGMEKLRKEIDRQIELEITDAVKYAEESSYPNTDTVARYVYA